MVSGDAVLERTFRVDRRASTRYLWRVQTDAWEGSR